MSYFPYFIVSPYLTIWLHLFFCQLTLGEFISFIYVENSLLCFNMAFPPAEERVRTLQAPKNAEAESWREAKKCLGT